MSLGLEVFPVEDWPRRVAAMLERATTGTKGLRLCLATGNTTRPVYQQTALESQPEIFLLDEFGGLPRDDPARCAAMLRRDLPGQPFHAPDVDAADPVASAGDYARIVGDGGLDLALVGLGRNGHLGMNEPGSARDSITRVVDLADSTSDGASAYGASTRPKWGITVGIGELMAAEELWLVVTGAHKRQILAATMSGPIGPDLPASFLREHANAVVLADRAAVDNF